MLTKVSILGGGFGLIALLVAIALRLGPDTLVDRAVHFDDERVIQYSFTVKNDQATPLDRAVVRAYAPVQLTSHQQLRNLSASHEHRIVRDELGNTVTEFVLQDLGPFESRIVNVRATVATSTAPLQRRVSDVAQYLRAEPFIETGDTRIKRVAERFSDHTGKELAEAAHRWVASYLKSEDYIEDDRGAAWALEHRRGDCTEYMYLYLAVARINGLPARGVGGYVLDGSRTVGPAAYHNWVEVYVDGAWQIVDPQRRVFMSQQADYIAMRIVQPAEESLLGRSHRYASEGQGLVVRMN